MIELAFQKVRVPDCEGWIAKEYYVWGKSPREPEWEHATAEQRMSVIARGYRMYDGSPVPANDLVSASDVGLTVTIFSRVTADNVKWFLFHEAQLSNLLAAIRPHETLLSASREQIDFVGSAIDQFCSEAPGVQRSKATKVLHRKRPDFIPVIDGNVGRTLQINFPHALREGSGTAAYLSVFRGILSRFESPLNSVRESVRATWHIQLSLTRTLSFLLYQWYKEPSLPKTRMGALWGTPDFRRLSEQLWGNG